jgi:high-affinity Fe2+/Pb2+ permease
MTRLGRQASDTGAGHRRRNIVAALVIALIVAAVWFGSGWLLDKQSDVGWTKDRDSKTSQE